MKHSKMSLMIGSSVGETRISPRTKVVAYKKIVGKVTRVSDGDTVWVTDAAGRHKIRLLKIDASASLAPTLSPHNSFAAHQSPLQAK